MLVLEIAIDSLGAANNTALGILTLEVFGKKASIGVRVITTDNNETIKVKCLSVGERACELLRGLNLMTSRTFGKRDRLVNALRYLRIISKPPVLR